MILIFVISKKKNCMSYDRPTFHSLLYPYQRECPVMIHAAGDSGFNTVQLLLSDEPEKLRTIGEGEAGF
jgi:hypothetical protein